MFRTKLLMNQWVILFLIRYPWVFLSLTFFLFIIFKLNVVKKKPTRKKSQKKEF